MARAGLEPHWHGPPSGRFRSLHVDSRRVGRGDLFCAIHGTRVDGHEFVDIAARAGAAGAVVQRRTDAGIPQLVVADTRLAAAHLASLFAGDPGAALRLIGITGTNGKSTTAWLVRWILAGTSPAAAIGTLGTVSAGGELGPAGLTTPGPVDLALELAKLRAGGAESVAIEVSSHALDQRRVDGFSFDAVAFTSFSREHLEYHSDVESYRSAKLRLAELLASGGVCVVDDDEPAWREVGPEGAVTLRCGTGPGANVRARDVNLSLDSSRFLLCAGGEEAAVSFPFPADFNVKNALVAAGAAWGLGVPLAQVASRLSSAPPVPGRMEILSRDPVCVIRDFAHNPGSCERALSSLRAVVPGRLIAVLGCGGDRDPGKRPLMGEVLARLADIPIVTSDNPRSEEPAEICRQMVASLPPGSCEVVVDRRRAIERAVAAADSSDVVALLGKGHQTTEIAGGRATPFDERQIVAELLAALEGAPTGGSRTGSGGTGGSSG